MFERGLFVDYNWVSNGEAFWQPLAVKDVKFIEQFLKDKAGATVELRPKSKSFLFEDRLPCVLLASNKEFILVQAKNLEAIGVNLEYLDEYQYWMNPDTRVIYVYDPDFIGGTLPLSADKDNLQPAYPNIGKES